MKITFTILFSIFTFLFLGNLYAQNADFSTKGNNLLDFKVPAFNEDATALTTATWTSLTTSPHAVSRSCCAYIRRNDTGFVYQFGGGAAAQLNNVAVYNLRTSTWTNSISTMPFAISAGAAIADGDSVIYVFGGNSPILGKTMKWRISTNTWTTLTDMPTPATDMLCVKYQDSLVYAITGGDGLFGTVINNAVRLFRMRSGTWTALTNFPITVSMMGGGIYKDTIIVTGGWTGAAGSSTSYKGVINPANPTSVTWTTIASYPTGGVTRMASHLCLILGQGVGIACTGGAIDGATLTSATNFWNFCTQSWQSLPPNPLARSNFRGTGAGDSLMYVVGGFTTVGVGNFDKLSFSQIDGFCSQVPRPLNAFNLQTPAAGSRIVTVVGSSTPVTITWDTSATGATYKFIFGNPVVPPRRITIPSGTNSINTTLGALDNILAVSGFTNNGSATDSAVGQWDVWAFKGPGATGPDSLKATNGPRALTLRRQQVSLSPFALVSPASGITVNTSPINLTPITFNWRISGVGPTYRWLYKTGATYTDPATIRINTGLDTFWTVRISRLDTILAGIGVNPGDSITGQWRARAYNATDSLNSTAPDRTITFRRAGLLPLAQAFTDPTFPPPFWSLVFTGTQYWTRQAGLSSYGGTQGGCAKFDFWVSSTGTIQSLVSNQFPPVTAPFRNLAFDWTQALYLSGGLPADDSLIVYTSTDAGTTYSRLIGYGANAIPFSSLSTTASQSQYIPPLILASHWGTKKIQMPLGTNKVRFEAISDFGNNLYIDSVRLSDNLVNISIPLTLIPEKYSLEQNYPNPFNPTTTINFSIPKQGLVTLRVYDILGKEIATLVNGVKPPGFYHIDFDASNFASGVYFYKIDATDFSDIKRMMLIK